MAKTEQKEKSPSEKLSEDFKVFHEIVKALEPFDEDTRIRILRATAILLDLRV